MPMLALFINCTQLIVAFQMSSAKLFTFQSEEMKSEEMMMSL